MFRGTTPTFRFIFKQDIGMITKAVATFSCNRNIIFEKELSDMVADGNTLSLKLSQEETLLFPQNSVIELQIAVACDNGNESTSSFVGRSKIWKIPSKRILREALL